jgi:2-polyprenyl-3-methyl-5-hydroxy-6-metoxy-1,4-benzoquinol methylase
MPDQINGKLSPYLREQRFRAAEPYLATGRILDVGCGIGLLTRYVSADRYLGVDLDAGSVEEARRRNPGYRFLTLDGFAAHDPSEQFDTIVGLAVIEHVPDPKAWLDEMKRRLAPGGRMVLTTPHPRLEWAHTVGARLGLFSRAASEEHNVLIDPKLMRRFAGDTGLTVREFKRFLYGANQLFILQQA